MRVLDLFCGGGGAGHGYALAGFDVTGVDIEPHPEYPYTFVQADAVSYLREYGREFDAVHASPPCQGNTPLRALPTQRTKHYPDFIIPTRNALADFHGPWVMENVPGAAMVDTVSLCGTMFDLMIFRHRLFESNWKIDVPAHRKHPGLAMRAGYLPTLERPFMSIHGRNGHNSRAWVSAAAAAIGTPWLSTNLNAVCEAIPPAYTEHIGRQLAAVISDRSTRAA